jgi:hypothetical protein
VAQPRLRAVLLLDLLHVQRRDLRTRRRHGGGEVEGPFDGARGAGGTREGRRIEG